VSDDGRWRAEPTEPFNAGLDGTDPETVRRAVESGDQLGALVVVWCCAAACLALAVVGPSVVFACIGALLAAWAIVWTIRRPRRR
jgi:hypothetical protein